MAILISMENYSEATPVPFPTLVPFPKLKYLGPLPIEMERYPTVTVPPVNAPPFEL